jgi:hypothetical protein
MGAIRAPELQPLNFSVKFESISTLGKMLAHFVPDQTSLWVNPTWYLLTDGVLFFGFERYQFSLPVPDVFQKKSADYCLVPRKQLTESVALLAAVEKDPDARSRSPSLARAVRPKCFSKCGTALANRAAIG